jgi:hypothetical protein
LHLWGLDHAAGGEQHARLLPELLVAKQQQQQEDEEEEQQQQQAALAPAACRRLTQAETVHWKMAAAAVKEIFCPSLYPQPHQQLQR